MFVDRGLSPATCEKIYIDTARYLDTYGVHMFPATWVSSLVTSQSSEIKTDLCSAINRNQFKVTSCWRYACCC